MPIVLIDNSGIIFFSYVWEFNNGFFGLLYAA